MIKCFCVCLMLGSFERNKSWEPTAWDLKKAMPAGEKGWGCLEQWCSITYQEPSPLRSDLDWGPSLEGSPCSGEGWRDRKSGWRQLGFTGKSTLGLGTEDQGNFLCPSLSALSSWLWYGVSPIPHHLLLNFRNQERTELVVVMGLLGDTTQGLSGTGSLLLGDWDLSEIEGVGCGGISPWGRQGLAPWTEQNALVPSDWT